MPEFPVFFFKGRSPTTLQIKVPKGDFQHDTFEEPFFGSSKNLPVISCSQKKNS